ncbi:hypothetical protein QFC21_001039 [Naganishia friedmannii]|uniref:Uncharacterized protein n=1 Tax=Naganishia friedmannii TaxID=89922 RepID=A0ACC2W8Z9_9TREE|nr:hypothetical protein QFC21_001039 [Naganishia friedmannii]
MDASYIFDFAVGLLDISYLSWFLIASHYKLRPSSFDFILKRRDRMQEWRSEMDDLPKTVICITSPFLLFGHIGMGIVDIIMFLPLMGAFLLLHIIVAACLWWIMPLRLRPIRAIHACLQASFCGAKVCLGGIVQLLTMICAYGKARRAEFQYALRQFAPFEQLATIRQHRAKKACATKRSLHSLVVPERILLLQEYAKLRVSALKRSANQLMTPELVAFAQEWRRPAEAEIKRTFRQHLKPENTPVFELASFTGVVYGGLPVGTHYQYLGSTAGGSDVQSVVTKTNSTFDLTLLNQAQLLQTLVDGLQSQNPGKPDRSEGSTAPPPASRLGDQINIHGYDLRTGPRSVRLSQQVNATSSEGNGSDSDSNDNSESED